MADRIVTLRGGRKAGVQVYGDPVADRFVVFCHPSPGSAMFDPAPLLTNRWGVHVVGLDRPGYGASLPLPADAPPTIGDRADDLAEYLQIIQGEARAAGAGAPSNFGVVGWSAGGRVALALAARYPRMIDRVAVIATPAPHSAVPWIPSDLAAEQEHLRTLPPADARARLTAAMSAQFHDLTDPDSSVLAPAPADEVVLDGPGVRSRLHRMLGEAYRQGVTGMVDDVLSIASDDWGFDLRAVQAKTLLVYGAQDPLVPSAHGRWYRRHLRHAHLTVVPRSGHLAVVAGWQQVLEHVAPGGGSVSADRPR